MMIVISPQYSIPNEIVLIHAFFKHGLDYFHVRKYSYTDQEMRDYLAAIDKVYRRRLVLHSHYHLADEYGIERLHIAEKNRNQAINSTYSKYLCSTSVHHIDEYNTLNDWWSYAFLSPVFPSISKPGYGVNSTVLSDLSNRENKPSKLIGLGGIDHTTIPQALTAGFDGVALMGAIWNASEPLNQFLKCKLINL